jgi:methylglutamate dehydrogenase subunit B
MRIPCPYCGPRDIREFAYLGDAAARPADPETPLAAMVDQVYLRRNPAGPHRELWYHAAGCRSWLVVERDTVSHAVGRVAAAAGGAE